jgi:hypothetical protein
LLKGIGNFFHSVDEKKLETAQNILERSLIVNRWFSWLRLSSFIILGFGFDLFGPMSFLSVTCLIGCALICMKLISLQYNAAKKYNETLEIWDSPFISSYKIAVLNGDIAANDSSLVEALCEAVKKVPVDSKDADNFKVLADLIILGVDPNAANAKGETPLALAVGRKDLRSVEYLVGVDPHKPKEEGEASLASAVRQQDLNAVQNLCNGGDGALMGLANPLTESAIQDMAADPVARRNARQRFLINQNVLQIINFSLFVLGLFKGGSLLLNILTSLYGPNLIWPIGLVCVGVLLTCAWMYMTHQFINTFQARRACLLQVQESYCAHSTQPLNLRLLQLRSLPAIHVKQNPNAAFPGNLYDLEDWIEPLAAGGEQKERQAVVKMVQEHLRTNPYNSTETTFPTNRLDFCNSAWKNRGFKALVVIAFLGLGCAICVVPGPWQTVVPAWSAMMNCALSIMVLAVVGGVLAWYDSAPNDPKAVGYLYGLYAFGIGMMVSFGMLNVVGVALNAASGVCAIIVSLLYAVNYGYSEYERDLLCFAVRALDAGTKMIKIKTSIVRDSSYEACALSSKDVSPQSISTAKAASVVSQKKRPAVADCSSGIDSVKT